MKKRFTPYISKQLLWVTITALALSCSLTQAWMPTATFWSVKNFSGIQLFSGALGGYGAFDANGTSARIYNVYGLTNDGAGNLYFSDTYNDTFRKMDTSGNVTTLVGRPNEPGGNDGTGTAASLRIPLGMARDTSGNFYIADSLNMNIRKITPANVVTTFAGSSSPGFVNGTGTGASFNAPSGVVIDTSGNLFVADTNNYSIRKITTAGVVTTFAGTGSAGSANGTGTAASFSQMSGIAIDSANNIYVADTYNHLIRKITSAQVVTTLAGAAGGGYGNGTGTSAKFAYPRGVATDSAGNVYVADTLNYRIRKITSAGVTTTIAGSNSAVDKDGTGTAATFNSPWAITSDSTNLYISAGGSGPCAQCSVGSTIRKLVISSGVVTTIVGSPAAANTINGALLTARFNSPAGLVADSHGNLFVVDKTQALIREIGINGSVSTFAGGAGGYVDATGTAASFQSPTNIAIDASDNLYVTDTNANTIRKITPAAVVTTFAGQQGTSGFTNATGTLASFSGPLGIAVDKPSGNIFVADQYNNVVRKITSAGVVTTFVGGASSDVDGTGTSASTLNPQGLAIDSAGNLYLTEYTDVIRKITSAGVVTTLAGSSFSSGTANGTGAAARFLNPYSIAVSPAGNIYVGDILSYSVRKITPAGVVTTPLGVSLSGTTTTGALPGYVTGVQGLTFIGSTLYYTSDNAILRVVAP